PMPAQKRLPIWMGYQGPKGARRAGLLGEGLLSATGALYEPYRQGLIEGGHDPSIARMAGGIQTWVSDDPEADWPEVKKYVAEQVNGYRRHMFEGADQPTRRPVDMDKLRQKKSTDRPLDYFMLGTPEAVAKQIQEFTAGAPVETVFIWASYAGMPEALVA